MAKKSTEKNIRKITKIGKYSYTVSIPISVYALGNGKKDRK